MVEIVGDEQVAPTIVGPSIEHEPLDREGTDLVFGPEVTPEEAKSELTNKAYSNQSTTVDQALSAQGSIEETAELVRESGQRTQDLSTRHNFYPEDWYTVDDPSVTYADHNIAINTNTLEQKLLEAISTHEDTKGVVGYVTDFLDREVARASTIGIFEAWNDKHEKKGTEFFFAMANMGEVEFSEWVDGQLAEAAEEGIFKGNNYYALLELYEVAHSFGVDDADFERKLWSILDIAGFVPVGLAGKALGKAAKTSVKVSSATHPAAKVAGVGGPEVGAEAAEAAIKNRGAPEDLAAAGPRIADPVDANAVERPTAGPSTIRQERDALADEIFKDIEGTSLRHTGEVYQPHLALPQVVETAARLSEELIGRPVMDMRIADDGSKFTLDFGNTKGNPVKKSEALKHAAKDPTLRAVPLDKSKNHWKVVYEEAIDPGKFAKAVDNEELASTWYRTSNALQKFFGYTVGNRFTAGSYLRDIFRGTSLANRAEGMAAGMKNKFEEMSKPIKSLGNKDRMALSEMYRRFQNGPMAHLRTIPEDAVLEEQYRQITGQEMTPAFREAFIAQATREEVARVLNGRMVLDRFIAHKFWAIDSADVTYLGQRVDLEDLPQDARILDENTGGIVRLQDLEAQTVWKLDREETLGTSKIRYVANPKEVRMPEINDVMGSNIGGQRVNPHARGFLVFRKGDTSRAFLTTYTQKQGMQAMEEIRKVFDAYKKNVANFDEILEANNGFNPAITNRAEFEEWVEEYDLGGSLDLEIAYKDRDSMVHATDQDVHEVWQGQSTDMVYRSGSRNDKPLPQYGGEQTFNGDPLQSINRQLNNVIRSAAYRAYNMEMMNAVGKRMMSYLDDKTVAQLGDNPVSVFRNADLSGATDPVGRRLRELQQIINRRNGMKTEGEKFVQRSLDNMTDFVFDTVGKKVNLGDPSVALTKLGFASTFGFFNVSQVFVQAAHVLPMMAISPRHASVAVSQAMLARPMLSKSVDDAAYKLWQKRMAKAYDMTPEQVDDYILYIKDSGRAIVDADVVEDGTPFALGYDGYGGEVYNPSAIKAIWSQTRKTASKAMDASYWFFREGERATRLTSMTTAYREWVETTGQLANTPQARKWLADRDETLSFHMANASRGQIQQGLARVPFQWYSYTLRSFESVFVGRSLTAGERARAFVALGPIYGLTGLGVQHAAYEIGDKFGMDPEGVAFDALKYGLYDALFSWASPTDTAIAPRVAPAPLLVDTYKRVRDDNAVQLLLGPSGDIVGGGLNGLYNFVAALATDKPNLSSVYFVEALRTFKGVDNVIKARAIMNDSVFRSKTGREVADGMGMWDAVQVAAGFTPQEVVDNYDLNSVLYATNRDVKRVSKTVQRLNREFKKALDDGDYDKANVLGKEIFLYINGSALPPNEQRRLRSMVLNLSVGYLDNPEIINRFVEQGRLYHAEAAAKE